MKKVMGVCFILLLFLTSCSYLPKFWQTAETESGDDIKVEFVTYPEGELVEDEQFAIKTRVTNYNTAAGVDGTVCIYDFVPKSLGGIPEGSCSPVIVERADEIEDQIYEKREEQVFTGPFSYNNLRKNQPYTTNIAAMFSYVVESEHFAQQLCVKLSDEVRTSSECERGTKFTNLKQPKTPLQVTEVTSRASPSPSKNGEVALHVNVIIKKQEEGNVASIEDLDKLISVTPMVDVNVAYADTTLTCTGLRSGRLVFSEDVAQVSCRGNILIPVSSQSLSDSLAITLRYGFQKVVETPAIKLVPNEEDLIA